MCSWMCMCIAQQNKALPLKTGAKRTRVERATRISFGRENSVLPLAPSLGRRRTTRKYSIIHYKGTFYTRPTNQAVFFSQLLRGPLLIHRFQLIGQQLEATALRSHSPAQNQSVVLPHKSTHYHLLSSVSVHRWRGSAGAGHLLIIPKV